MHDLDIVAGNLKIVGRYIPLAFVRRVFTDQFFQKNVFVDSEGAHRVAGPNSGSIQLSPARSEDLHELPSWMAPELVDPQAFGLPKSQPTKASDVYAFAMVVYEVKRVPIPMSLLWLKCWL